MFQNVMKLENLSALMVGFPQLKLLTASSKFGAKLTKFTENGKFHSEPMPTKRWLFSTYFTFARPPFEVSL